MGGGPGIEFLEYLAPRDGRAIPKDERANDLTHWQTRLIVRSTESAEQFLLDQKSVFVSTGVVAAKDLGFKRSLLVRDPDGHVMQLIEK